MHAFANNIQPFAVDFVASHHSDLVLSLLLGTCFRTDLLADFAFRHLSNQSPANPRIVSHSDFFLVHGVSAALVPSLILRSALATAPDRVPKKTTKPFLAWASPAYELATEFQGISHLVGRGQL
jgi:hypothetical protein